MSGLPRPDPNVKKLKVIYFYPMGKDFFKICIIYIASEYKKTIYPPNTGKQVRHLVATR
jgi:hypothetical protein